MSGKLDSSTVLKTVEAAIDEGRFKHAAIDDLLSIYSITLRTVSGPAVCLSSPYWGMGCQNAHLNPGESSAVILFYPGSKAEY